MSYCLSKALSICWKMLERRKIVHYIRHSEALMFSISLALIMSTSAAHMKPTHRKILSFFFGPKCILWWIRFKSMPQDPSSKSFYTLDTRDRAFCHQKYCKSWHQYNILPSYITTHGNYCHFCDSQTWNIARRSDSTLTAHTFSTRSEFSTSCLRPSTSLSLSTWSSSRASTFSPLDCVLFFSW